MTNSLAFKAGLGLNQNNTKRTERENIMAILWRHSALAHRHAAIGGELEDWNGMGTAWFYDHSP
ncbi:MAG: hypothetical protein ACI853_001584, partial [Paracoccaceae bacterium]